MAELSDAFDLFGTLEVCDAGEMLKIGYSSALIQHVSHRVCQHCKTSPVYVLS